MCEVINTTANCLVATFVCGNVQRLDSQLKPVWIKVRAQLGAGASAVTLLSVAEIVAA